MLGLWHAAEVLGHEGVRLRRVEVTDDHERRVLGHVIGSEKLAHILDGGRLEVCHAADRRVLVRVRRECLVVDDLVQPSVRLVVHPHPPLFLDHLALVDEVVLLDTERRHPVGLEPRCQRQVLRRKRLPEHCFIVGCVGVALASDRRNERGVLLGPNVLRALEHHVLEEVRKAGAALLLVLRADVVPHPEVHDRRGMILGEDHRQPVREG